VQIQVVYFDGCPSWRVTYERLVAALEAMGRRELVVDLVQVASPDEAAAAKFAGSPTILVDGLDLFPGTAVTTQLACRVYPTPQGLSGSPTVEALIAALSVDEYSDRSDN
jgi:hypothetical protein